MFPFCFWNLFVNINKYALLLNKYTAMVFKTAQLLSLVLHMWHIGLFPWTTIRINLKLLTAPWSTVWILSWSLHRVRMKPFCRLIYSSWKLVLSKIKQSRHFIRSNDHHCLWYACFITWPKIQIRLKAIPRGSAGEAQHSVCRSSDWPWLKCPPLKSIEFLGSLLLSCLIFFLCLPLVLTL